MIIVAPETAINLTTDRTSRKLAAIVQRAVMVSPLNSQAVVWTYELPDHRTINLVISRRSGRILRAFTTDPRGGLERCTGTPTGISRTMIEFATQKGSRS